jgi:hypothetical protein
MKIVLLLPVFVAITQLRAAEPKPPLTRIEYRNISPEIQPDSFAAKPKILYIGGTTYSRTEEQPDPPLGIHGLIVIAEPEIWMVNLIPRVAQHIVDPGPTFNTYHNILERDAPKEFSTLEFGREAEFFRSRHATPLKSRLLDEQRCEASEFRHANYRVILFTRADTQKPFHLDVFRDDKPYFSIRYLSYETNLPFDAELFKPPTGVKIIEAKPTNSK